MQSSKHILMVRPASFGFNAETASSNSFQCAIRIDNAQELALREFDSFVALLEKENIEVTIVQDELDTIKPDAIFPNNWFSVHETKEVVLYPMLTENRRNEARPEVFHDLFESQYSFWDLRGDYSEILEGTGSMVLDRVNRIAYACLSERTNANLFHTWCNRMNFKPVTFVACDQSGNQIYHTNVVMTIGTDFVLICLDCIPDELERLTILSSLKEQGRVVLTITKEQMNQFCANALEVQNNDEKKYLICSRTAFRSYTKEQLMVLSSFCKLLVVDIPTIEQIGGGSARCMLAELF
jgi:hypothetical protein